KDFSQIFAKVNQGKGTIGKLINDEQLYKSTVNITQSADKSLSAITTRLNEISDIIVNTTGSIKSIMTNVDSAVIDVRTLAYRIERGEGVLGSLIVDKKLADSIRTMIKNVAKISNDARIATSSFAENMEALKHNWLFKNYFEQRGYWSKAEYEKEIETKMEELKKQNENLDRKIKQLLELEKRLEKAREE
ncbi:MAG: hypothetical protein AB1298_05250, partial [Bacteroidota bacterium]